MSDTADNAPRQRDLRPLRRLLPYLSPYKGYVALAAAGLIIAASGVLVLGVGLRFLIDQGFAEGGSPALLDRALVGLFGVIVIMAVATFIRFYMVSWIGERIVADLRRDVFKRILGLDAAFFETSRTGALISYLTTDTTLLQTVIGTSVPIALRNGLILIGGLGLLFFTSPKLTGLVLLVIPLTVLPLLYFGRKVRRLSRGSQERLADLGAFVDESLRGIRTVQVFSQEEETRRRFGERVEDAFGMAIKRIGARAALSAVAIVIVFSAIAAVLWQGGHAVLDGRISAGQLAAFIFYAVMVAGSVGALSEVVGDLQRAAGAAERLLSLLAETPKITAPAQALPLPEPARGAVAFDDVTFHYPARPETAALAGLDFTARPGETVAVVGPSGAGKSTVFQLLLRLYDPQSGRILVDDTDIRLTDPQALRRRFSLVPQEPDIFSASALENIRFGRPEASAEEVRAAARAAHADVFIDDLPEGFDTYLGERGIRLSGGQKQRLAIARALLRDPAVLLLDEATSNLDAESERLVQEALDTLMRNRTTLVIAHRLATVQRADKILVMDRGRLVESGTHAALADAGGLYAHLAALQFDIAPAYSSAAE